MKNGIIIILLSVLSLCVLGQDKQVKPIVSAKVVDRISDQSVGWASMWSYQEGSSRVIKVSYAKSDGSISWQAPKAGSYKLVYRADGYIADSIVIVLTADTTLEIIKLFPDLVMPSLQLEEAVVTAERPLLAHFVDRYVYDVSRDPEAKRKKMTEIIEKIPGLNGNAPTGTLEYNGEKFQQILIDGERHEMINTALQFPMRMIRADVMSKIEIIPPGSPQYNNERPILNIITARALPNGYAFEASGDADTEQNHNGKLDFISKIRDLAIVSLGYNLGYSNRPKLRNYTTRESFNTSVLTGSQQSEGVSDGFSNNHNFRFGTSFKIFGNILSLNANTSLGERFNSNKLSTLFFDAAGIEQSRQATESNNTTKIVPRLGLGAYYGMTLPSKYRLGISYTYSDGFSEGYYSTLLYHSPTDEQSGRRSEATTRAKESAARIAFNPPVGQGLGKHRFSGNIQFALRYYDNLSEYWLWDDAVGEYAQDFDWNNGLSYIQRIASTSLLYMFSAKKLIISLSLTGGYESNQGTFYNPTPSPLDYGYAQINPNVNLVWKPRGKYSMGIRYVNRTVRPGIDKLNPYLDDSDPTNLLTGNPHLRPEASHLFTFNPILPSLLQGRIMFSPTVRYTIIKNAIERATGRYEEEVSLTSYVNLDQRTSLDVGISASLWGVKWISGIIRYYYQQTNYKSNNIDVGKNTVKNSRFEFDIDVFPWKGGSLSCTYRVLPSIIAAQSSKVHYYNDFSLFLQQTIIKNKFSATLSLDNPFESHRFFNNTISGAGFTSFSRHEQLGRILRLSLRANFGRFKDRIAEQGDIIDDRERVK
ncbi:MAG: outer membrane beta-barrel family protein [Prevotellaceae bacterium]|nr:outer membrane beta-barrel family protein [Prevotellaceae bacterium]